MTRLYTRQKRHMQLTSSFGHKFINVKAKHRPKTFATKEGADAYAKETLGLTSYHLEPAKKNKRWKVVQA
ncbi:MAG: hypothetical protein ACMXYC_04770 [Candidatus Woesearchaeota archaeon]